jgi:ABC-2 type transport system permease protein
MSLIRIGAVARKEALHIWRDPLSLLMAVGIPIMLMLLYGYALSLDVNNVPLIVYDQDGTPASRDLASRFTGSRYFALRGQVRGYEELNRAIDTGAAMAGLIIPAQFEHTVQAGGAAAVELVIDGSDAHRAQIAIGYARMALSVFSQTVTPRAARRNHGSSATTPLELRGRAWFNEELESRNAIVPGLIAVIMSVIAALLTSLTVAREWELGTMEQLIATPVRRFELVAGKLAPYALIGMTDLCLCILMSRYLFAVPLRGSVILLMVTGAAFLTGALALGMLISIATRSSLLAVQTSMTLTYLPALILSGFFAAIVNMPAPIRAITYVVPARYFVTMLKSIYLKGLGVAALWNDALLLLIFGAVMLSLAVAKFRKRMP